MDKNESGHSDHHDELHAPPGVGKYLAVTGALMVLTLISFVIGNNPTIMATPSVGWVGMMTVSCAKAMLVILFFMHLKWEANWKYVLTIPASLMSLFLLLMLVPDVGMRTARYNKSRWLHASPPRAAAAESAHSEHDHSGQHDGSDGADHAD